MSLTFHEVLRVKEAVKKYSSNKRIVRQMEIKSKGQFASAIEKKELSLITAKRRELGEIENCEKTDRLAKMYKTK